MFAVFLQHIWDIASTSVHLEGLQCSQDGQGALTDEMLCPLPVTVRVWSGHKLPSLGELVRNADPHALPRRAPEEWQSFCILKSLILFCDFRDRIESPGTQPYTVPAFVLALPIT